VFYTFDSQGNVAQRLNDSGAIVSSDMYDGFGNGTSTASSQDCFGFGAQWGYYTDAETGLILCTHRYYDPGAGRWLTRDPIGYGGGVDLYGYVGNDPVNKSDMGGEQGVVIGVVVGVVIVGVICHHYERCWSSITTGGGYAGSSPGGDIASFCRTEVACIFIIAEAYAAINNAEAQIQACEKNSPGV
jgi:RHS repeat-associated protein